MPREKHKYKYIVERKRFENDFSYGHKTVYIQYNEINFVVLYVVLYVQKLMYKCRKCDKNNKIEQNYNTQK